MNNKISFIMPPLLGATVIAGVAALVIITVFKLLLGLTLLAGVTTLVVRSISKQRKRLLQYEQGNLQENSNWNAYDNRGFTGSSIQPVENYASKKATTIVPIS